MTWLFTVDNIIQRKSSQMISHIHIVQNMLTPHSVELTDNDKIMCSHDNVKTCIYAATRFGERGLSYCGPAAWNTLPSDLHDITDTGTFRKRLKSVLYDRAYRWLLLALLDVSYSGALQISRWLIDWIITENAILIIRACQSPVREQKSILIWQFRQHTRLTRIARFAV